MYIRSVTDISKSHTPHDAPALRIVTGTRRGSSVAPTLRCSSIPSTPSVWWRTTSRTHEGTRKAVFVFFLDTVYMYVAFCTYASFYRHVHSVVYTYTFYVYIVFAAVPDRTVRTSGCGTVSRRWCRTRTLQTDARYCWVWTSMATTFRTATADQSYRISECDVIAVVMMMHGYTCMCTILYSHGL